MPRISSILTVLSLCVPPATAWSQEPVPLTRIDARITLDGVLDEPVWQTVPTLPMTVFTPMFGGDPTERTEVYVAYDDEYLYVAGRLFDSDPAGIRGNTFYRDRYSGDDIFSVIVDSYNDYENALWFSINPLGARTDRSVSNDAEGATRETFEQVMNQNWNTFWDVATEWDDEGWSAEIRIPFSSLRFEDDGGNVVMGLIVYRYIARKNERHLYPAIPPDWAISFVKPSQAQRVSMENVRSKTPVYITPYGLGGISREPSLNSGQTGFRTDTDRTNEVGLDLKYSPSSNLTVDVTLNTDFAQVEVDDQQVNLTRFSLFFPEKRQFFQERSGLFEFSTGGFSRLFHSRTIGLDGDTPVRILGGARLIGRAGGTEIGMLSMQTATSDSLPAENFTVLRLRQQVLNRFSNVGGLLTTRFGNDGTRAGAFGLDGILRLFGDEYLTLRWAASFDDETPDGSSVLDASRVVARWERRNQTGFAYFVDFIRSGREYDPAIGFVLRDDFTFVANKLAYRWLPGEGSPVREVTVQHMGDAYFRNGGAAESALLQPSLQVELKNGIRLSATINNTYESIADTFALSGGPDVLPGDYWFHEASLSYAAADGQLFRPTLRASAGTFFDGWRASFSTGPTWNPSKHLEIGGNYTLNVIRFPDRNERLNTHLVGLRIQTALNIHLSLSTFLQFSSTADLASTNARLRYHFREGNDLWLVYDEGFNTERNVVGGPRLPVSAGRTLLLKYTYTFGS